MRRRPSGLLAFKSKSYRTLHTVGGNVYSDHSSSSSGLRVSVSNMGGANQWRKESVTIIESQEPMEEDTEENEGDVESDGADKEPVAQTRSVDMKYKNISMHLKIYWPGFCGGCPAAWRAARAGRRGSSSWWCRAPPSPPAAPPRPSPTTPSLPPPPPPTSSATGGTT